MKIFCIKHQSSISKIVLVLCAFMCLHGHGVAAQEIIKPRLTISAGVSQAICISTAKYSSSKTIQEPHKDPSKFQASNKATKCELLQWNKCGSRRRCPTFECPRKGTRIVGGTDALPHEFPYQIQVKKYGMHDCGGTILNEKFIISAAHCFHDKSTSIYSVVAGVHNKNAKTGTEQERIIKTITVHENYDKVTTDNDISLLQVDPPFDLTDAVQPVLMPQPNYAATGDVIVTGWGSLRSEGYSPSILQKVTVPIITNKECSDAYGEEISSTTLCAGLLGVGGKDACQGDSGGPLVVKMANGSCMLVGIVSWGIGCAEATHPGVYTQVAKFLDWISKNAGI